MPIGVRSLPHRDLLQPPSVYSEVTGRWRSACNTRPPPDGPLPDARRRRSAAPAIALGFHRHLEARMNKLISLSVLLLVAAASAGAAEVLTLDQALAAARANQPLVRQAAAATA